MLELRSRAGDIYGPTREFVTLLGEDINEANADCRVAADVRGTLGRRDVGNYQVLLIEDGEYFFGQNIGLPGAIGRGKPTQHAPLGGFYDFGCEHDDIWCGA